MVGSPSERKLDLDDERVARIGIIGGIPDRLEIGLQFGHRGELKHVDGFETEFVLVDDGC